MSVGDTQLVTLPPAPSGFRKYHMLIPPHAIQNGDMTVAIHSETWGGNNQDARVLGVAIATVDVQPLTSAWWNIAPSLRLASLVILAVIAALIGDLTRLLGVGVGHDSSHWILA
jgi:hypothetical protein